MWESLFDYQTDVLATIAADDSTSEIEETLDGLSSISWVPDPGLRYPAGPPYVRCAGRGRRQPGGPGPVEGLVAVDRCVGGDLGGVRSCRRRRIEAALEQAYLVVTERMERIYQAAMDIVGFRVRSGLTIRQFTIAVAALTEGCVLRNRVDAGQMNGIMRPTGPGGQAQEWTLFGLALEALAEKFFEPDPGWEPPDLATPVGSGAPPA